jgi:predicted anti-sigma-YlaC factor YlaD
MRRFFKLINQNCRLASRLMSDEQERQLSRLERCGLQIHLMGCRSCRRYRIQIQMLERLVASALREPHMHQPHVPQKLSSQARMRIEKSLAKSDTT